ncbi:caspase-3-like [Clytia hemisphaerica]|uniref:caspase-3-like n=1 Tax=Clytia hemisphaerica TaxID=252671 RepID=UPI0034D550E4
MAPETTTTAIPNKTQNEITAYDETPNEARDITTIPMNSSENNSVTGHDSKVENPNDFIDAPPSLASNSPNTEVTNSSKNNAITTSGACAVMTNQQQTGLNPFLEDDHPEDIQPCLDIEDVDKFQWKTIGAGDEDTIDGSLFLHSNKEGGPNFYLTCMRWQRKDYEGILTRQISYRPKSFEACPPLSSTKRGHSSSRFNVKKMFSKLKIHGVNKKRQKKQFDIYSDDFYPMNTYPRGTLLIINMKNFSSTSPLRRNPGSDPTRKGTDIDAESLTRLFLDLGFYVERLDNPTTAEIRTFIKETVNEDHSNRSICACAVLSHGEDGLIYSKDGEMKIDDIVKPFRIDSLAGKPKLFIIQACRGDEYMESQDQVDGPPLANKGSAQYNLSLPSEADVLYAYSTVSGYFSWRNQTRGSWFIEALVKTFRAHAHKMDVLCMLTKVNSTVADRFPETTDAVINKKKQISSFVSQLRQDLFLFPPYGPLKN